MAQQHGMPALLSFFFPGLGQLVKGQWTRALLVWGLYLVPAAIWVIGTPELMPTMQFMPSNTLPTMISSPVFPVVVVLSLIVWLWSVVDAYRRPA